MKKKWFVRKNYGWGWRPMTFEGWAITFAYIVSIFLFFFQIDSHSHSVSDTLINFLPLLAILTVIFVGICYKTGEKPEWRWGPQKSSKKKS